MMSSRGTVSSMAILPKIRNKKFSTYKPLIFILILALIFQLLFYTGFDQEDYPEFEKEVSPTGEGLENPEQYRFAEHDGKMIFGPYHVDEGSFYFSEGRVLNKNLSSINKPEVENLHQFYLKTYMDPLFYSPGDMNLSGFSKFEKEKVLASSCGLEYDVIPEKFFDNLENNNEKTDKFLGKASIRNAEVLIGANKETVKSYAGMVGNFIELLDKDVERNKCFLDIKGEKEGVSLATYTPVNYGINDEVLFNYSSMANRNAQVALNQIKDRKEILRDKREYNLSTQSYPKLNGAKKSFEVGYNSSEALKRFNDRRIGEYLELFNGSGSGREKREDLDAEDADSGSEVYQKARLADEEPVRFDMKSYCLGGNYTPVYGWEKNVYPNIISAETLIEDSGGSINLKDFFTVCRCPYVEITRLEWYVLNDQYSKISERPLSEAYGGQSLEKISDAEKDFLDNPGDKTSSELSETYETVLREKIAKGQYHDSLPAMWRRNTREESKIHRFEESYDDFWNEDHMDVWSQYYNIEGNESFTKDIYNYFFLIESGYSTKFMTYSESVWRLEEKPEKFSGKIDKSEVEGQFIFSEED